jgi:signal transduction histidine kinase
VTGVQTCALPIYITYLEHAKESFFHIAAPISEAGILRGHVYGTVGTRNILVSILNVSLGRTGECYLVDKNGTFLAHKEPDRILKENISQSESFKNIFGGPERKRIYQDYRGIEVLGTFQKVSGTDWYLVVEQDRDEAFQSADVLKRSIALTVLLCIGSAVVITWVFSFHVARPIRALSRWADTLAESRFEHAMPTLQRGDEIGMLYRAFSNMARKVRERQHTLEHDITLKDAALKETDLTLKQIKLIAERSEKFAAIGRLGAAVAHEIRTPLASLKLFLESVESDIKISPEFEEDFAMAMGQVRRIEEAINQIGRAHV